jgi:hypothetical protein
MASIEPMSQADALQFLLAQARMNRHADNCWIMFAVERLQDNRMIGEFAIYVESAARRAGDLGWSLQRDACGQGYSPGLPMDEDSLRTGERPAAFVAVPGAQAGLLVPAERAVVGAFHHVVDVVIGNDLHDRR